MAELQKLLVKDLMVDFGITRMTNLGEAQFLDIKFERIVNLCAEIVGMADTWTILILSVKTSNNCMSY